MERGHVTSLSEISGSRKVPQRMHGHKELTVTGNRGVLAQGKWLPRWLSGKESACQAGDAGSIPGSGKSLGEGNGYSRFPVFLPGEFRGQSCLVGYCP